MFGTMGFSELIIILVIVLIIFGAGRLPQIGEGVGKALKGFKKEVNEMPPPVDPNAQDQQGTPQITTAQGQAGSQNPSAVPQSQSAPSEKPTNQPYKPGPELTPGTTAALLYKGAGPEVVTPKPSQGAPQSSAPPPSQGAASSGPPPVTMEQRATQAHPMTAPQYPPLPPTARPQAAGTKRPSAIVNKQAVARVQAQQAALKEKRQQAGAAPQDLQSLGEGLGSALRTFREAANDVRSSIDPEMKTIQAELQAAEKEMQDTIESAKQPILPKDPPPKS